MRSWFMRRLLERAAARLYHRETRERHEASKVNARDLASRLGLMQYDPLVEWYIAGIKARRREICEMLGGITT